MMRMVRKLKTPALMFAALLCSALAGCGGSDPASEDSVTSIRLRYNGAVIPNNTQTVALSLGTLEYTAEVQVTGKASTDFTLESSAPEIATVSDKTVTLLAMGQTKIKGTAVSDTTKTHTITLNVVNTNHHSITVTGGTADKETALATDIVTLTAGTQTGKVFSDWTIEPAEIIQSLLPLPEIVMPTPNSFVMPPYNVTVTGNFETDGGASKPYNITNNFGEDSSAEFLAQWHNAGDVTTQTLQYVSAAGSFTNAQKVTATGESFSSSGVIGNHTARNIFRARVTGLSPNTRYKYRTGGEGAWSPVFYHLTSGGSFADFSFTVITDPQDSVFDGMRQTLREANAFDENHRFFLCCGDLVEQMGSNPSEIVNYTNAANEFNISRPIVATQGNHDTYHTDSNYNFEFGEATVFNAFVTFPDNGIEQEKNKANRGKSYYFYYNNVLFIMLNTTSTDKPTGQGSADYTSLAAWLKGILETDRAQGLSKYTIVGTHVGPLGNHYYDNYYVREVAKAFGKIFSDYNVDIVFHGHDHTYTRTNPIKFGTNTALNAMNFDSTPNGTVFSIVGATGPKFYGEISGGGTYLDASFVKRTKTTAEIMPGVFVNVRVTGSTLYVTVRRKDGLVLDTYDIAAKGN